MLIFTYNMQTRVDYLKVCNIFFLKRKKTVVTQAVTYDSYATLLAFTHAY